MDFNNVDLNDGYERDQNIIDPLSFDTLLLEISCNLREINRETVLKQFEDDLQSKITSAREIIDANIDNIVKKAREERAE